MPKVTIECCTIYHFDPVKVPLHVFGLPENTKLLDATYRDSYVDIYYETATPIGINSKSNLDPNIVPVKFLIAPTQEEINVPKDFKYFCTLIPIKYSYPVTCHLYYDSTTLRN